MNESVSKVSVAGIDDAEWGQRVVAWIVPSDPAAPPSLADLRSWSNQRLPSFMAPKQLVVVNELPRTSLGKVSRQHLVDALHSPGPRSANRFNGEVNG